MKQLNPLLFIFVEAYVIILFLVASYLKKTLQHKLAIEIIPNLIRLIAIVIALRIFLHHFPIKI